MLSRGDFVQKDRATPQRIQARAIPAKDLATETTDICVVKAEFENNPMGGPEAL
jgi:hypothetical protein